MRFSSEMFVVPPEGGTTNAFSSNASGNAKAGGQFLPRRLVFGSLILKQPEHINRPGRLQQKTPTAQEEGDRNPAPVPSR
jgi:hypothetical protein